MHRRLLILIHFFFIGIASSFGQFYPVNEMTLETTIANTKFNDTKVQSFSISNLITVKEFKEYLQAIKKDSSTMFYKSQLPASGTMSKTLINDILSNPDLQNKPMPGVSWTAARNYCTWLNRIAASKGLSYEYDLPLVSELIAFNNLYCISDQNELETWTLNFYVESIKELPNFMNYQYNAIQSDPPAMKRKVIFGGSYHMNYRANNDHRIFQYEYQDSSSRFIGFRIVRKTKDIIYDTINLNDLTIKYSIDKNQLDGIYQENYPTGKLKVLGTFSKGQRTGIWTIWDEKGIIKIQRNYTNNKICDFLFPITNNPYFEVYNNYPEYLLQRNDKNIYPYFFVEERAVVFSQRVWREINIDNEPELFRSIDFDFLIKELFKSDIKWYLHGKSGDFKIEIPKDSLILLEMKAKTWDYDRIEIKEDFFFNIDNLLSDTRQIGVSFYEKKENDKPSYTVYYPSIRSIMSTLKVDESTIDGIKTLDDVFFFHAYRGRIIKRSNVDLKTKSDDFVQNDLKFELEKFTIEHDLWLMYNR